MTCLKLTFIVNKESQPDIMHDDYKTIFLNPIQLSQLWNGT